MTLKTFTSAFAKYVNLDELVYDIALLALALFLRGLVVPPGKNVVDILNPFTGIILFLMILFSVSYFFGFLQIRYSESFKERPDTLEFVKGILMIVLLVMIVTLFLIFFEIFPGTSLILSIGLVIGGLCMVSTGLAWSFAKEEKDGYSWSIGTFLLSLIIIHFFVSFYNCEPNPASIFTSIGIFAAGAVVLFLLFMLNLRVSDKLFGGKNKAGNMVISVIYNILIPLITALMLGFWQEIAAAGLIGVFHSGNIIDTILPVLLFLTFIATRVLMALAPPYRIVNTGIGIVSFTVYTIMLIINLSAIAGKAP